MGAPNLLVIMVDQMSSTAMSCTGNPDLRTPNLDRLAASGVRFSRAYATFPLCGPFRSAMVTGRYPHQINCMVNRARPDAQTMEQSMGHLFRRGGYTTAYGGKWHVPTHDLADEGEQHGFECICGFNDDHLPIACERFLRRRHDRPFLLVASFDNPHNICEHSRDQCLPWGEVEDMHPSAYPNLPSNFAPPAYEAQVLAARRREMAPARFSYTEARWRRYRHVYYRLCEKVDAQIGRILEATDASGQANNTVILFLSDHGDHAGAHGLVQKSTSYEESAAIPFILCDPRARGGRVSRALVNGGIDLLPTLLDFAGITPPAGLPGVSVKGMLDPDRSSRDAIFLEARLDGTEIQYRAVITARYKYTLYDRGQNREMLFDLLTDPGEMVNRAVESRFAPVLDEHRRRLYEWCLATGDTFGSHYSHAHHPVIPGIGFAHAPPRPGSVMAS